MRWRAPRRRLRPAVAGAVARCRPGQPCWPTDVDWQALGTLLRGRLETVHPPIEPCRTADAASQACTAALAAVKKTASP
jgi:hypothetical protein